MTPPTEEGVPVIDDELQIRRAGDGVLTDANTRVVEARTGAEGIDVAVYVTRLRRKIEADPARPTLITTEPGVGYRFGRADR